jgi:aminoglycoside 6'-N-acetyltransferase I
MGIEIKVLGPGDDAILRNTAPEVLDRGIDWDLAREFLNDPRHHFVAAMDGGVVVGFASGVHYIHPDKPAQMFINEVGVAETHRGRGIGRKVVQRIVELARELECSEAWVLTDRENEAALRMYERAGGKREKTQEMFTFKLKR